MDDTESIEQRMTTQLKAGNEFGAQLVGLTQPEAERVAGLRPEFDVHFVGIDEAVSMDLRSNRIRACMRDGVVVDACAG